MATAPNPFSSPLRLEYLITERDYVNASVLASLTRSKMSAGTLVLFPVVGALMIAVAFLLPSAGSAGPVLPISVAGAILLMLPLLSRFRFRRTYHETTTLSDRRGIEADLTMLRFWSATTNERTQWKRYGCYTEDDETFVLFEKNERDFIAIPKRDFTEQQIDDLRVLFQSRVPRK